MVNFDETGQPVGDEGNEFNNFLGTLVKRPQHVSINCRDWRKISKDKKEDLWSTSVRYDSRDVMISLFYN